VENNTAQLEARVQKLESMIMRFGAAAAAAALSFAGPTVADQAAAAAIPASVLTTSPFVFTLSQDAIWQKIVGAPGAVGVPPLTAQEVIATTDGTGVLARTDYSSPRWRIGVNDIFINSTTGNDQNDGLTVGTPIQTGRELFRRWGWGARVEVGCNLATSP
jgi:hypothetical protein